MDLTGKTVLVTGATGFIGGRVAEKLLLEHNAQVRALVHDFHHAAWLSRTAANMVYGDITDADALRRAVQGCALVVHCVAIASTDYADSHRVNVTGTRLLLEAAHGAGVERVVLLSSVAIHAPALGPVDENSPWVDAKADTYARTKLEQEQLALRFGQEHGLPVVVLRPTIVYGPRATFWTVSYAMRLHKGELALSPAIRGENNFVYVDDVAQAVILAAGTPATGEAFIIGAAQSTRWVDFIGQYAAMAGKVLTMWPLGVLQASAFLFDRFDTWLATLRKQPACWKNPAIFCLRALRRLLKPWHKLERWEIRLYTQRQEFRIDKARRLLGYSPQSDLAQAMQETAAWLRAQGYLPAGEEQEISWPTDR